MEKRISGHTGLMGLFGSPVGHSGSPAMYNFSFQHDGLDYAYLAFDVTEEEMPKAFEAIRLFKMRAGNFTMPCKNIAAKLVDKLSPAAEIIGACNAFVNDNGVITGYITDGVGFVKNLEINGVSVKDKKIVVLGAGGAATAIQVQLALDGAKEVNIFNVKDKFYERAEGTKAKLAAEIMENPKTILGMATGSTPVGLYKELVKMYEAGDLDFSQVTTFNLDEYIGLAPEHDQSYHYFMNDNLFDHVNINKENVHVPDGVGFEAGEAGKAYEELMAKKGFYADLYNSQFDKTQTA